MTNKTPKYTIIGVDVSKLKLDIALDDKQVDGFKSFLKHIMTPSQVGVVMEATGGYERAFAHFLLAQGITVSVANTQGHKCQTDQGLCQSHRPACQK